MKKIVIVLLVVLIGLMIGILIFNTNVEVEYVPEVEIEEVDLRKTMIALYFQNSNSKQLQKETRLIDSKELLLEPYEELLNMLIEGPQSDFLEKTIPEGTKLLGTELVGNCLKVNFSKEFSANEVQGEIGEQNYIKSIVNTLTELNEVDTVQILVEGEEVFSGGKGEIMPPENL